MGIVWSGSHVKVPQALRELDLTGKTFVVTGGASGIGLCLCEQLAARGACVVVGCRRAEERRNGLAEKLGESSLILELDLGSLDSVRVFARALGKEVDSVECLVCNGG